MNYYLNIFNNLSKMPTEKFLSHLLYTRWINTGVVGAFNDDLNA